MDTLLKLKADLKAARLNRNTIEADTLRTLIGDIENELSRPNAKSSEDVTIAKLTAFTKNANLFIENLQETGQSNSPLIAEKDLEKTIYARFLPVYITHAELKDIIVGKFSAHLTDADKGPVNKFLKAEYAGKYQGGDAAHVITTLISEAAAAKKASV